MRVDVYWKFDGALIEPPTQGLVLGQLIGGNFRGFADATVAFIAGDPTGARPLNSLRPIVLEHRFGATESDRGPLYLRLWALDPNGLRSRPYVQGVECE